MAGNQHEWARLEEVVNRWNEVLGSDKIGDFDEVLSDALAVPEFKAKGVRLDGSADAERGPIDEIPTEYFRQPRTFSQNANNIYSYHVSLAMEQWVKARNGGLRHPDYADVLIHRAGFEKWLAQRLRNSAPSETGASITPGAEQAEPVHVMAPRGRETASREYSQLQEWLRTREANWPTTTPTPNEKEDLAAIRAAFPWYEIGRDTLRKARQVTSARWKNQGPKMSKRIT